MNHKEINRRLIRAEMEVARFNAFRTSVNDDHSTIRWGRTELFEYLLDSARPDNPYYNRAVSQSGDPLSEADLRTLPLEITALEFLPAQLSSEVVAELLALRFVPSYQLCYLGIVPTGGLPVERDVIRLDHSDVDRFFDLLELQGVSFPEEKRLRKRGYYCTEEFQAYVVLAADGTAQGWSTMYVKDRIAFLGNSFTLREFRCTGVQTALLAARLNAAAELRLDIAYTDVEHGSQSHYNCERTGFRTLTINTIWEKRR